MSRYTVKPRVCINGEVRPPSPGENTTFCAVYFREADGCERWVADVDATHPTTALDTLREIVEDAQPSAQELQDELDRAIESLERLEAARGFDLSAAIGALRRVGGMGGASCG